MQSLVALGSGLESGASDASWRAARAAFRFSFFSAFLAARCSFDSLLLTMPEAALEVALFALVALLVDFERRRVLFGVVLRPRLFLSALSSSRSCLTSLSLASAPLPALLVFLELLHRLDPSTGHCAAESVCLSHTVPMYSAYSSAALRSASTRAAFSSQVSPLLLLPLPLPLPPMHATAAARWHEVVLVGQAAPGWIGSRVVCGPHSTTRPGKTRRAKASPQHYQKLVDNAT